MADEQTMTEGTPSEAGASTKGTWKRLAGIVTALTILLMIVVTILAGFIPPFVLFFVLLAVGWWLLTRGGKAGAIVLIVGFALFVALNAPFLIPNLAVPASAFDFVIAVAALALGITGLIAAIAVLRGRGAEPSGAARTTGRVLAGVFVLSIVVGVVARATYDEPAKAADDVTLMAANTEFSTDSLDAGAGEVSVYVTNEDGTLHTFTIDELDVDLAIPAGTSARVTFDAEPGEYRFYCVPHEPDMNGTLTVQ